jgi:hypothetical protein
VITSGLLPDLGVEARTGGRPGRSIAGRGRLGRSVDRDRSVDRGRHGRNVTRGRHGRSVTRGRHGRRAVPIEDQTAAEVEAGRRERWWLCGFWGEEREGGRLLITAWRRVWRSVVRWTAQIPCRGVSVIFFFKRKKLRSVCFLGERVDQDGSATQHGLNLS